ncbi:MAG: type I-F CRISPR-associated protein Csy2, partial [bacterium]
MKHYVIIKKMRVTEATMESSPVTAGFPSVPSFMGFTHALEIKLRKNKIEVAFDGVGIISHEFTPHIQRVPQDYGEYRFALTKNPPTKSDDIQKTGRVKTPSFIEEGKADMTVSMVIEITSLQNAVDELQEAVRGMLPHLRLSGGVIWRSEAILAMSSAWDDEKQERRILQKLMPGFALKERRDLLRTAMDEDKSMDALDAILAHLEIHKIQEGDNEKKYVWRRKRETSGWLVPISVGFQALTPLGKVRNQRDPECLHRFAENVLFNRRVLKNGFQCPLLFGT